MADRQTRPVRRLRSQAFTLVELLVVIGIIALLISILLPVLNAVREQANATACASNLRQLCTTLTMYAGDWKGKYPPNISTAAFSTLWYDVDVIGKYLPKAVVTGTNAIGGNVMFCPSYEGAARSYAMNFWASGAVPQGISLARGDLWNSGVRNSSQMILMTEKWAFFPFEGQLFASATVGHPPSTPGQRFGAGSGAPIGGGAAPVGAKSELPYHVHRKRAQRASHTDPVGKVNVGYADGHVVLKDANDLANFKTGKSRYDSLWSPNDRSVD